MSSRIEWILEKRKLAEITEWDKNPRTLTKKGIEDLKKSIEKFGCAQPVIINTNNIICGGHGRKKVLEELKIEEVDCYVPARPLTDKEFEELNIRLNKNIAGEFDYEILANSFDASELLEWGFSTKDFSGYALEEKKEIEEDEAPELKEQSIVKRGDLWKLGNHLLLCGDSASLDEVKKLTGEGNIDMVFTDPPYNLDYDFSNSGISQSENRKKKFQKIKNDALSDEQFDQFINDVLGNIFAALKGGGSFYISSGRESTLIFNNLLKSFNFHVQSWLVWIKEHFNISRLDYHPKHEIITYGWKEGAAHTWFSDRKQVDILQFERDSKTKNVHPTQKPVGLIGYFLQNSSKKNDKILDLFGGSGSTLIACEQLGRQSFTMELDEKYCQVIIERYINLKKNKGDDVFLIREGEEIPFNKVNL